MRVERGPRRLPRPFVAAWYWAQGLGCEDERLKIIMFKIYYCLFRVGEERVSTWGLEFRVGNYSTEMRSGFEAGSYLGLIDFVHHSTLGSRAIKKKRGV